MNKLFYGNEQKNQFAFKSKHSTEMFVYILKQIIFDYTKNNTPVYACFIDMKKKTFDRVNNDKLINILVDKYWLLNQQFFVKWGATISSPFKQTCRLRQG